MRPAIAMNHPHYPCPHSPLGSRMGGYRDMVCPAGGFGVRLGSASPRKAHWARDLEDCVAITFIAMELDHSMNETRRDRFGETDPRGLLHSHSTST